MGVGSGLRWQPRPVWGGGAGGGRVGDCERGGGVVGVGVCERCCVMGVGWLFASAVQVVAWGPVGP